MTRPPSPGTEGYPALVEARCVIAATTESIDTGTVDANGRSQFENRPVVILDDGSAFRLNSDGEWRKLRPVPSTHAGIAWQRTLDAKKNDPVEE